MATIIGNKLGTILQQRGLIPVHCRLVDVVIPVQGPVIIKFEKFVDADELDTLAEAMKEAAAAAKS